MAGMQVEGEPTKRYTFSYHGNFLGSLDAATALLKDWQRHNSLIRPVVDRKKQGDATPFATGAGR